MPATTTPKKRPTSTHRPAKHATSKPVKPHRSTASQDSSPSLSDDDDGPMASTFLQYCAFCDSQIIVPNQSTLYCSENCRKRDTIRSPNYSLHKHDSSPAIPHHQPSRSDQYPPTEDILPQRSPTLPSHPFPIFLNLPNTASPLPDNAPQTYRPPPRRTESEAAKYLRQFQTNSRRRAPPTHAPDATTPSLTHTPASSTSTSTTTTSHDYFALSSPHRPLPPRTTPGLVGRSVDLVTPLVSFYRGPSSWSAEHHQPYTDHSMIPTSLKSYPAAAKTSDVSAAAAAGGDAGDGDVGDGGVLTESYKKRHSIPVAGNRAPGRSSLMQLFKFEEMRAAPKP